MTPSSKFQAPVLGMLLLGFAAGCGGEGSGVIDGACTSGERRCDGEGRVVLCQTGTWVTLDACSEGSWCSDGACVDDEEVCTPDCSRRVCGSDGCEGICGVCEAGEICSAAGQCVDDGGCEPLACEDVPGACGTIDDGCGSQVVCEACATDEPVVLAAWASNCVPGSSAGPSTASPENEAALLTAHGVRETAANHDYHSFVCISDAYSTKHWNNTDYEEKYWQVRVSTLGHEAIRVSSLQSGSNTGPRDFRLQYSADGTVWSDAGVSITVAADWETGVVEAAPLPADLEDQPQVYIRWLLDEDAAAINGGDIGTTGAGRIDHVVVEGAPL